MKKNLHAHSKVFPTLFIIFSSFLIFIFQAQIPNHIFHDDDPSIEQPTRESYSYFNYRNDHSPYVITINDYDNFDIGVDYWENHVTTNPYNPLLLFFGVNGSGIPQNARGTTNGGLNWYLNNPQYPAGVCCDPWTSYTGSGILIYASGVNGEYVYRSSDNGLTWASPVLAVTGNDRNIVVAEETGSGPYANYVYAAITPGNFARSTDAGATWAQTFNASNTQPGCYIAVGPNGTTNGGCVIYCTNTGSTQARTYNFYRSLNGGANFTLMSSINVVGYVGTLNSAGRMVINGARTNPHPKLAMDNSNGPYRGRLYLVYATNDPPGNGSKPDVWLQCSTDQGASWVSRVRVNDNPNPELSDQWFPEIWCEKNSGRLYIHWYDDRSDPVNFGTDIYASYSSNGGVSFTPNLKITNATWSNYPNPPCAPNTNCYRGDYSGITANSLTSFSIWADHRTGASATNMGAYFPDYAMHVNPSSISLNNQNDSGFIYIAVPSIKLYTDKVKFTSMLNTTPPNGTVTLTFLNKISNVNEDSLTVYPDSLRLRIKTTGGVTSGSYTISITGAGSNGTPVHRRAVNLYINPVGLTQNQPNIPGEYMLYQNYPNPFNPSTNIRFDLPKSGLVKLTIFDISGKTISKIINDFRISGKYNIVFNAELLSSGVYFYKLETTDYIEIKKMIFLK